MILLRGGTKESSNENDYSLVCAADGGYFLMFILRERSMWPCIVAFLLYRSD